MRKKQYSLNVQTLLVQNTVLYVEAESEEEAREKFRRYAEGGDVTRVDIESADWVETYAESSINGPAKATVTVDGVSTDIILKSDPDISYTGRWWDYSDEDDDLEDEE